MVNQTSKIDRTHTSHRRALILAPVKTNLDVLKEELHERKIHVYTAYDLDPTDYSSINNIENAIKNADLIVAVIPEKSSANIFFELGIAHALNKPFLALLSPNFGYLPSDLSSAFYLRIDPQDREAIAFALDQCLNRSERRPQKLRKPLQEGKPLGERAEQFLTSLHGMGSQFNERKLENFVADVLRASGVSIVKEVSQNNVHADIVIWSDDLQPIAGNPMLIEVKSQIRSKKQLLDVTSQIEDYRIKSGSKLALLVVNTTLIDVVSLPQIGSVLMVSLTDLIKCLRTRTFADTIRSLWNDQVHDGSSNGGLISK